MTMNISRKNLLLAICSLCILAACSSTKQDFVSDEDWISLALKSEIFIEQAKFNSDEGETWKIMPDSINSKGDKSLYSGAPGIIIFYLELYNATNNPDFLDEAKLGADYLISTLHDSIYSPYEVGLYIGIAGIGFSLTEVYKSTKDPVYLNAALKTIDLLEASATKTENGINWGSITDIVYGSSGIGLYLHYIADELKLPKADSLSLLVANELLENPIKTSNGLRWKFLPDYDRFMDNFSHGTAGIAYFLSQTYLRTQNQNYLLI